MKLRIKTITIFIAITICLIIIIHFVSESIILGSAIQLEQAQISSEIGRLQTEWTNELARYQTTADSWAQKSGTSDFIKAQSANPKGSSQVINSLVNLGVNYLMLYDSSGKFIAGFGFNLTTYQQEPLPTSLVSKIQACSSIIGVTAGAGSGVLQIPTGLLIVSSAQITPSVNQPAEGDILVLARYLDADEISMLQRALQMPVSIQPYAESQSSSVPQSVTFSVPIDTNYVVGYSVIKDYNGAPAFLLGVTMSRTVYVQGVITLNYIDRLVLVSCVVFSLTIFITFEFLVLSKLSKLTNAVTKISQHNNPSERLPTKGNDEFETLTGSINKMLGEIEENNEKLQKAQRFSAIGELSTMVAHDLRNPLQGIAIAAFYLKRKTNPTTTNEEKQMISQIEEDVRYSDKIVNDLLDYSKDIRLDLQVVSPQSLLWGSLSICTVPEKIRLIDETSDEPLVLADVDSMKRVFGNIICNAVDAMPNGGNLKINCQVKENMARFTFADTGLGITEEVKGKIFQPLFTTKAKGMGFGLSICKRIIEGHRGRIEVESVVGKGSVFSIYLPLAPP